MAGPDTSGEGVVENVVRGKLPDGGGGVMGNKHTQEQVDCILLLSV